MASLMPRRDTTPDLSLMQSVQFRRDEVHSRTQPLVVRQGSVNSKPAMPHVCRDKLSRAPAEMLPKNTQLALSIDGCSGSSNFEPKSGGLLNGEENAGAPRS